MVALVLGACEASEVKEVKKVGLEAKKTVKEILKDLEADDNMREEKVEC